jgi:hypothetical protein
MGYIKNFTNFTTSNEGVVSEETDVMLNDDTLTDLSTKIQDYKNQINQWEKAILDRKKVLADEIAKAATAKVVTPAAPTQPATS